MGWQEREPGDQRSQGHGKSHFVEGLAAAAFEADMRVAWFTLETLTQAINRAKADGSVARTVARICAVDIVVVEDIGMLPAGQEVAEAFHRVIDAPYERRSVGRFNRTVHFGRSPPEPNPGQLRRADIRQQVDNPDTRNRNPRTRVHELVGQLHNPGGRDNYR